MEKGNSALHSLKYFRIVVIGTILMAGLVKWSVASAQTLNEYLDSGLRNSPLLKDYSLQIQSQAVDSLKILAGLKPQVGLNGELMYPPAFGQFAYDSAITDGGHYIGLIRVDYQLFARKKARTELNGSSIQRRILECERQISETELKEAITDQYIAAYSGLTDYQLQKDLLNMLRSQQAILKKLVDAGIYLQTDYLNLSSGIDSRLVSIRQAYLQYKKDLAMLNLLCGIHDTTARNLLPPELRMREAFDINASPSMVRFRLDSLKSVGDHQLVDLAYRPHLGLYADAGITATNPARIPYNLGTSFGLSFAMPIYDGKQRELDHRKILLSEQSNDVYKSAYETGYRQRKDQLLDQLSLTDALLSDLAKQVTGLENLIRVYQAEISKGMVRWLDFMDIVSQYAEARHELALSGIGRLQIINQLNYLK